MSVPRMYPAQRVQAAQDNLAKALRRFTKEEPTLRSYSELVAPVEIQFEPHVELKKRVPQAVGLIRTSDTTQYGNIILESA